MARDVFNDIEATNAGPPSVELVAAIAAASSESAVGTQPSPSTEVPRPAADSHHHPGDAAGIVALRFAAAE
jgi:hypothetical protein